LSTLDEHLTRPQGPRGPAKATSRGLRRIGDPVFGGLARFGGAVVAIAMFGLATILVVDSWPAISGLGIKLLTTVDWAPSVGSYGILAALAGTLLTTLVAMVIAVPLALLIALLLTELVNARAARVLGTAIEMLAAIPSIIFGLWGISVIAPLMQNHVVPWLQNGPLGFLPVFGSGRNFQGGGFSILTAGLVLAVMVLPFITAVSRDVLNMVPRVTKEAGYGMGSTTWEVTRKISLRYSLSGIVGACFIGLGRALGETMAVAFIVGGVYTGLPHSLLDGGTTIASLIANQFNEANTSVQRAALIEMGLVLFLITVVFQALAQVWLRRAARVSGGRA
jgi:phosphate transport system permease protein